MTLVTVMSVKRLVTEFLAPRSSEGPFPTKTDFAIFIIVFQNSRLNLLPLMLILLGNGVTYVPFLHTR